KARRLVGGGGAELTGPQHGGSGEVVLSHEGIVAAGTGLAAERAGGVSADIHARGGHGDSRGLVRLVGAELRGPDDGPASVVLPDKGILAIPALTREVTTGEARYVDAAGIDKNSGGLVGGGSAELPSPKFRAAGVVLTHEGVARAGAGLPGDGSLDISDDVDI